MWYRAGDFMYGATSAMEDLLNCRYDIAQRVSAPCTFIRELTKTIPSVWEVYKNSAPDRNFVRILYKIIDHCAEKEVWSEVAMKALCTCEPYLYQDLRTRGPDGNFGETKAGGGVCVCVTR